MKTLLMQLAFLALLLLPLSAAPITEATAFERSLEKRVRAEVLLKLSDADLLAYLSSMKEAGTLLEQLRDESVKADLQALSLKAQGLEKENPIFKTAETMGAARQKLLQSELANYRKGLEVDASIAKAVLAELKKARESGY